MLFSHDVLSCSLRHSFSGRSLLFSLFHLLFSTLASWNGLREYHDNDFYFPIKAIKNILVVFCLTEIAKRMRLTLDDVLKIFFVLLLGNLIAVYLQFISQHLAFLAHSLGQICIASKSPNSLRKHGQVIRMN